MTLRITDERLNWSVTTIAVVGLWTGLLGGLGEVGIQLIRRYALDRFVSLGRDFVWLLPLVAMAFSGLIAILLGAALPERDDAR